MLICHDDAAVPAYAVLPQNKKDGTGGYYDRRGKVICQDFAFKQNDVVTVFSFSTPRWASFSQII